MLMILRGVAFREKGLHEAAIECFKRALKLEGRSSCWALRITLPSAAYAQRSKRTPWM